MKWLCPLCRQWTTDDMGRCCASCKEKTKKVIKAMAELVDGSCGLIGVNVDPRRIPFLVD